MSLSSKQHIFTLNMAKLIIWAYDNGYKLATGEVQRTDDQQELYYTGFTIELVNGQPKLVKSRKKSQTLDSKHEKKVAVDFAVWLCDKLTWEWEDIKPLGDYWVSLHPDNRWGGDFNKDGIKNGFIDAPHFEMNV